MSSALSYRRALLGAVAVALAACTGISSAPADQGSPTAAIVASTAPASAADSASPSLAGSASTGPRVTPSPQTPSAAPATPWPSTAPTVTPTAQPSPSDAAATPDLPPEVAALTKLLPDRIAKTAYAAIGLTIQVETDTPGGDMCWVFCPGELSAYAKRLGVTSGPITVATAQPADRNAIGVWVIAIRLPGADKTELLTAWADHFKGLVQPPYPQVEARRIAGKRVVMIMTGPWPDANDISFAYVHGDVLYIVRGTVPNDLATPPLVTAAFGVLP